MNRRYALARLGATLEGVPELQDRLNELGVAFETARVRENETAQQTQLADVFDRLYGETALMLEQAERAVQPSAAELVAIEESMRRVEGALAAYRRTLGGSAVRASATGGGGAVLLIGGLLLGGVLYLSQRD